MRVLVCGDREWKDEAAIRRELAQLPGRPHHIVVIHGNCRGADKLAGKVAHELGMPVMPFPADWSRYGRGAGHIRNQQMLDEGRPDLVLAFHSNILESKGTANMIARAKRAGITVRLFQN